MATDTSVSATSEAAILGRLIRPDNGDLRAEAAEALPNSAVKPLASAMGI